MKQTRRAEAIWIESKGYWQIKVQKDGVRRAFTSSTNGRKGKHEAEAKADKWLEVGTKDMKIDVAWQQFIDYSAGKVSASTVHSRKYTWQYYIKPMFHGKRLASIAPIAWQHLIDRMHSDGKSKSTIRINIANIRAFAKFCNISRYEIADVSVIIIPKDAPGKKEKHALTDEQIRLLFTSDSRCHYLYAFRFALATGMRRNEIAALKWSDIQDGILHIQRGVDMYGNITGGKTKNAMRNIRMSDLTNAILEDQRAFLKQKGIISPWIFCKPDGGIASVGIISTTYHNFATRLGINSTIHELRHTYITLNRDAMPLEILKQVVGHSAAMDTLAVYAHARENDSKVAAMISEQTLNAVLGK